MNTVSFTEGNTRELMKVSLPLMLSWLSVVGMTFVDRLYLAHYSMDALNATITGSMMAWAFTYGLQVLCEMSEVLVAQYNGAKRYHVLGKPVWQMIWLSLASVIFFIPLSMWGAAFLFPSTAEGELQGQYFRWLVFFGPAFGLIGAYSAFFIGQGKSYIFTYVTVAGNIINIILDPILIFGVEGWVPEMGLEGAAIATGLGTLLQALILFCLFIRKSNRVNFGSNLWRFDSETAMKCLKIGVPISIVMILEIGGWALYYSMMSQTSGLHILVAGVSQTILMLFIFFGIGLSRGVSTVAGNLIGAGLKERLPRLIWSALRLVGGYFAVICIPLIFFPDLIIQLFVKNPEAMDVPVNFDSFNYDEVMYLTRFGLLITSFYLLFDNFRFVYHGILASAGDTFFLMWTGVAGLWIFMIIPTYYLLMIKHVNVSVALCIWIVYAVISAIIPYARYRFGSWDSKQLIE